MYKTLKISLALISIAAATLIALAVYQATTIQAVSAQENNQEPEQAQEAEQASDYTYTAQPGDSYTLLARKAVQTYGINNNVNLSPASIIFAETQITQEAGEAALNTGQEVTINGNLVKKWIEAAQKLTEAEQSAWNIYVPFVNFNTDSVGESAN